MENESLAHQPLFVLERRAVQEQKTFRVDENACAVLFENLIPVARLGVQAHGIRQTGAAAALHTYAQAALVGRNAILPEQLADFPRGALGQVNFRDVRPPYFSRHTNSSPTTC